MQKFMVKFKQKHENDWKFDMYTPANTKKEYFSFRGEKMAKVIGRAGASLSTVEISCLPPPSYLATLSLSLLHAQRRARARAPSFAHSSLAEFGCI